MFDDNRKPLPPFQCPFTLLVSSPLLLFVGLVTTVNAVNAVLHPYVDVETKVLAVLFAVVATGVCFLLFLESVNCQRWASETRVHAQLDSRFLDDEILADYASKHFIQLKRDEHSLREDSAARNPGARFLAYAKRHGLHDVIRYVGEPSDLLHVAMAVDGTSSWQSYSEQRTAEELALQKMKLVGSKEIADIVAPHEEIVTPFEELL